jgi:prepilin-type processing-associated H-X9-DG protein
MTSLDLRADGVFFEVGTYSLPVNRQSTVSIDAITDGTSQTLLFSERSHDDPNYDTYAAVGWEKGQPMNEFGFWTGSCGGWTLADVTLSSYAPIDYELPVPYAGRSQLNPTPNNATDFNYYADLRLCAFGSKHPSGANFAMADGSARFLTKDTDLPTLRALSTRAGNEVVCLP